MFKTESKRYSSLDRTLYSVPYDPSQPASDATGLLHSGLEEKQFDSPDQPYYPPPSFYASPPTYISRGQQHLHAAAIERSGRRLLRTTLPAIAIPAVTFFAWIWAITTVARPIPMGGGVTERSTSTTRGITVLSTVLSIVVSWGFGRSVTYYVSKMLVDRACSVRELGSWVYLGTHQVRWTLSRWLAATTLAALFLGLQVSSFNAILQRESQY